MVLAIKKLIIFFKEIFQFVKIKRFHGNINFRPAPYIEIIPEPNSYADLDVNILVRI
jgi:hypothetical protein